jgi:hypothetical protein
MIMGERELRGGKVGQVEKKGIGGEEKRKEGRGVNAGKERGPPGK